MHGWTARLIGTADLAIMRLTACLLLCGCLVDTQRPCDAREQVLKGDFAGCVCEPGAVLNAQKDGCDLCGTNEVIMQGQCACAEGYARLTESGECMTSALGAACASMQGCSGDYPYCAPGGYCSKSGCATSADCPVGYACEAGSSPYCSRPPVGQGDPCDPSKKNADCTGAADYCAMGSCVVSKCASVTTCHGVWVCCDFTQFGLEDLCVAPSALIAGKCPGSNADPVTR